jgi:hypothetical protein
MSSRCVPAQVGTRFDDMGFPWRQKDFCVKTNSKTRSNLGSMSSKSVLCAMEFQNAFQPEINRVLPQWSSKTRSNLFDDVESPCRQNVFQSSLERFLASWSSQRCTAHFGRLFDNTAKLLWPSQMKARIEYIFGCNVEKEQTRNSVAPHSYQLLAHRKYARASETEKI